MELSMNQLRELICQPSSDSQNSRRQIVIGERGWVWVGDVTKVGRLTGIASVKAMANKKHRPFPRCRETGVGIDQCICRSCRSQRE